jgi:hypothetical protein
LVDAAARNDRELLDFLLKKIPNKFNLSFTKMCVKEGFIEVVDWWKEVELVEGGSLRELVLSQSVVQSSRMSLFFNQVNQKTESRPSWD